MFTTLQKILRLPSRDKLLLCEAVLFLGVTSVAVAVVPFRRLATLVRSPKAARPSLQRDPAATVARIRWAISTAARRVPWTAVCFQQALAAHLMLRRRGQSSTVYYGASQAKGAELSAHVWIRSGDIDVVGCEQASQYALLATFPVKGARADS